nr:GEVED domain-containing protein [Bacteroidota bacterium]
YITLIPYNELGDAAGCTVQSFRTELNTLPNCTTITYPQPGATNIPITATIQWAHAVGNQIGYKISIGTTLNGTDIANNINVGNVTSYNPPGYLPHSTTLYVKITPYSLSGDVPGCASQSFSTIVPVNGDFCFMATNLPCGQSISGNTSLAYNDEEAFTCGTLIQAPGIWFTFVGNGQNTILTTCGQAAYDIMLNAYTGTCSNLTCVTGLDDFCGTSSLLSFPTINNTTYYILVQGWEGSTGTFTLTRTCYSGPFYCPTISNNASNEWIKTFVLGTYSKQSASSTYSDFTAETITVSRGGTYPITITPQWLQSARPERFRVWVDLNIDGDFSDSGEQLFSAGPISQIASGNIAIPITATNGTTRLRVSMRYNLAPPFCDAFDYGEVEDYSINIRCNMVTSLDESTNGSLRNVSMCADDNESILFSPSLNNQTILVSSAPLTSDGIWKWMADPGTNIRIQASSITRLLSIPVSKSVEMQNLELIGGTATDGSTIDNLGTLILRNSNVIRAIGSSSIPLRNKGLMTVQGNCNVRP